MANTIKQKRGTTDPSASDLVVGELAINTTDGGLFTKTDGGTVVEIGSVDADTVDGLHASSFIRSDAADVSTGNIAFDGTLATFDPPGGGTGTDTATDVAIAFDSGHRIAGYVDGYIRTLFKWNVASDIEIGQGATSVIGGINLLPGSSGNAKVNGSRILTVDDEGTGNGLDADTVDGVQASSFVRSDANDTVTGVVTFNADVLIRTALDFADGDVLRMGSSDDWTVTYNSNGWNYINQKQNGIIFQDNGTNRMILEDSGIFRPNSNNQCALGTSSRRFNIVYTYNIRGQSSGSPGHNNSTTGFAINNGGPGYFSSSSNVAVFTNRNSNGTIINLARSGSQKGNIQVTTSGATFNSASDYRLKENVVDLTGGITRVKQLQPKRFNFIEDPSITVDGFIAHKAQTVVPEAVTGTKDEVEAIGTLTEYDGTVLETNIPQPDSLTWEETVADEDNNETTHVRTRTWVKTGDQPVYQGIDQSKLVPLLTAALQEAIAKIETLETQNADLLARVTALESS